MAKGKDVAPAKKASTDGEKKSLLAKLKADKDEPLVINVWDFAALKNNLDDRIKIAALEATEGFNEVFARTDLKLAVYSAACIFAGIACIYGYIVPHPESRLVVGICALMYFLLVSFVTIYITFFDPGYLLEAVRKHPEGHTDRLQLSANLPRFASKVDVDLCFLRGKTGEIFEGSRSWPVTDFFYEDGEMAMDRLNAAVQNLIHDTVTKKLS